MPQALIFVLRDSIHPRDIYSFPTRRSSDLALSLGCQDASSPPVDGTAFGSRVSAWLRDSTRSEEHTSELQSHSDLVCRLLLEKKNKQWGLRKSRIATSRNSWIKSLGKLKVS